jgi:hypothetical protein
LLPTVSIVAVPDALGVNRYQIDEHPAFPAWFGSPDSFVPPTLLPFAEPDASPSTTPLAKLSFAGPEEPDGFASEPT